MIWPWERRRRALAARLTALGASVEDARFDPDAILAAALAEHAVVAGRRSGAELGALTARFGTAAVERLVRLRATVPGMRDGMARPEDVTVRVAPRAALALVEFREPRDGLPAEAAVEVRVPARAWVGRRVFAVARAASVAMTIMGAISFRPDVPAPAARSARLRAIWLFELGERWSFVRREAHASAEHRFERPLDGSGEHHRALRDETVLAEAAGDGAALGIPVEIAEALPYEPRAALLELAALHESFAPHVIEAALRRVLACWAEASEGEPERLSPCAGDEAAAHLLDPPGSVLRGPELRAFEPLRVHALRVPPELTVRLDVRAYRGPADPAHAADHGIRRAHRFWWRLARQESAAVPWRLVDAGVDPS